MLLLWTASKILSLLIFLGQKFRVSKPIRFKTWNLIEDRPYVHEKLFLAGGLNVDNLKAGIEKIKPFAVDVASGVEKTPGKKDPYLLEQFIKIAKEKTSQHA